MVLRVPTIESITATGAEILSTYSGGQVGPVAIGEVTFLSEWAVACDDVGPRYYVHLPITGRFRPRYRDNDLPLTPRMTWVGHPGHGPFLGTWDGGYRGVCVSIEQAAVKEALGHLLGESVPGPVSLGPTMDVASGYGRSWANLLLWARHQLAVPGSLLAEPIVAAPLAESVVNGFLLAMSHSPSSPLRAAAPAARPAAVRAAIDLIEADPAVPLTVAKLAAHSGVSVRTLQYEFQRHLGMSPLAYLREARLRRAHEDLRTADPQAVSVAEVARRWGFAHLGRFAAMHHAKYGQTPLSTLRG